MALPPNFIPRSCSCPMLALVLRLGTPDLSLDFSKRTLNIFRRQDLTINPAVTNSYLELPSSPPLSLLNASYTYVCMCVCIYVCIYIHVCIRNYIHVQMLCMYVLNDSVCRLCVPMIMCVCVCMYVQLCAHSVVKCSMLSPNMQHKYVFLII